MKIVYYSKPFFADCDLPLIKALREMGHEVVALIHLAPYSMHSTVFDIKELKPESGIYKASDYPELKFIEQYMSLDDIYVTNDIVGKNNFRNFFLFTKEIDFIRKQRADIVQYVEDPFPFHIIPLFFLRKKLVLTIHDGKAHSGESNWKSEFTRRAIRYYIKKYILLNLREIKVFGENYGIPATKMFQSHLGYYDMLKISGNHEETVSGSILFFGRILPYKGVEYLLEAMEIVHKSHPQVKLIIAGKPNYDIDWDRYRRLDYIEIRDRFIEMDELADLIRSSKFIVCPYTDATQSGVINSAYALNKPVLATKVGGLAEMIDDGETGILVPPKDVDALSEAIKLYLDSPEMLERHSSNIEKNGRSGKGSWKKVAEEYISIYKAENHE